MKFRCLKMSGNLKGDTILKLKSNISYRCKFPGCTSAYYRDRSSVQKIRNKHFFSFPRECNEEELKQWKRVCRIDDNASCVSYHICEDHFLQKDFTNYRRNRLNYKVIPKHLELAVYQPIQHRSACSAESLQDEPQSDTPWSISESESLQDEPWSFSSYRREGDQDPCHLIEELSEMYSLITLPYLDQTNLNLEWVYRILSGEEGCERIVYETPDKDDKDGFVLIRDLEWDGVSVDKLHLIAVAYRPGVMSLRDLRKEHLGLLQNISSAGKVAILKKYGVIGTQLRIFIQYVPSFYHLHVHFTAMNDDICGPYFGIVHPLHSVIQNIQILSTYYQDVALTIYLRESDELFQEFETRGIVIRQPYS